MLRLVGISLISLSDSQDLRLVNQDGYGIAPPPGSSRAQDSLLCSSPCCGWRRHLLPGTCTDISSPALNELSGKQDAAQELLFTHILPMIGSISQVIPMPEVMKNSNGHKDSKQRWLSVQRATNVHGQISTAPLNCVCDKGNPTKIPLKSKQPLRRKRHALI